MLKSFRNIINQYNIPTNARIIIAVSAGADSVALVHLFAQINTSSCFRLELAHIRHNIRCEEESNADLLCVQELSSKYNLPLHLYSIGQNVIDSHGREQTARTHRRKWLLSLCKNHNDFLALAHHADDHVETIFMRIQQHYPLKGLAGIATTQYPIIRPLLHFSKEQLTNYLIVNNFKWNEDSTNQDIAIKRNAVRQMIGHLKPIWQTFHKDVIHLSQLAQEHNHLIEHLLKEEKNYLTYCDQSESFHYPYPRFLTLHHTIRNALIYDCFDNLMRGKIQADYRLPSKFLQSINMMPNGSILLKGHGILIHRKKSILKITKE